MVYFLRAGVLLKMNRPLSAENLNVETTSDGRVVMEPQYLGYLRSNGFSILEVKETHVVASEDSDKAHIVQTVVTRRKPDDHPELDYVADKCELTVCDCWAFRSGSADVTEHKAPTESSPCKHIESVDKVARAMNDESQETLA